MTTTPKHPNLNAAGQKIRQTAIDLTTALGGKDAAKAFVAGRLAATVKKQKSQDFWLDVYGELTGKGVLHTHRTLVHPRVVASARKTSAKTTPATKWKRKPTGTKPHPKPERDPRLQVLKKAAKKPAKPKKSSTPRTASGKERKYHVVVINEKTGKKTIMSRPNEPVTHAEGLTMLSKLTDHPWRRKQLEEAVTSAPKKAASKPKAPKKAASKKGSKPKKASKPKAIELAAGGGVLLRSKRDYDGILS